jgi:hypothetical protein
MRLVSYTMRTWGHGIVKRQLEILLLETQILNSYSSYHSSHVQSC